MVTGRIVISNFFDLKITLSGVMSRPMKNKTLKDRIRLSNVAVVNELQAHPILSIIIEFFYPSYN